MSIESYPEFADAVRAPLQPCPFCGSNQNVEHDGQDGVTCLACDAFAPLVRWQQRGQLEMALNLAASVAVRAEVQAILAQVADDVQLPPQWQLEVAAELRYTRRKYPNPDLLTMALGVEAGEAMQAAMKLRVGAPGASREALRKECIQTIAMAVRVMEEGDPLVIPEVPCGD